jgi:hypothetical protein
MNWDALMTLGMVRFSWHIVSILQVASASST